jgi:hypothetical protein
MDDYVLKADAEHRWVGSCQHCRFASRAFHDSLAALDAVEAHLLSKHGIDPSAKMFSA